MMEEVLRDTEKHKGLDAVMKSKVNGLTSSIITTCIPRALVIPFFGDFFLFLG
jgi:DNA-directed RNA polymerase I subunit RPA1